MDVNLGARFTQVPDNPNTRYTYIQGSIIEHAQGGLQTDNPRRDCTRIVRGSTDGCGFIRGLKIPQKFCLIIIIMELHRLNFRRFFYKICLCKDNFYNKKGNFSCEKNDYSIIYSEMYLNYG